MRPTPRPRHPPPVRPRRPLRRGPAARHRSGLAAPASTADRPSRRPPCRPAAAPAAPDSAPAPPRRRTAAGSGPGRTPPATPFAPPSAAPGSWAPPSGQPAAAPGSVGLRRRASSVPRRRSAPGTPERPAGPPADPGPGAGWYPPGPPRWVRPVRGAARTEEALAQGRWWRWASLALVLIGGAVAALTLRDQGPSYPSEWDSRILPIVHFDEQERGMVFKHPVQVLFMTPRPSTRWSAPRRTQLSTKDKQDIENQTALMRALGLIDGKVDLFKEENGLNAERDPRLLRLPRQEGAGQGHGPHARRAGHPGPRATHALQDQYFDLGRQDTLPDDSAQAYRSVIEGDAVVVQNAYADTMSQADQDAVQQGREPGFGPGLLERARHPGGPGLRALHRRAGLRATPSRRGAATAAINDALRNPPASTAALMNIFNYLSQTVEHRTHLAGVATSRPAPSGPTTATTPSARLQWYLLLARRINVHEALERGRRLAQRHQHRVPPGVGRWCAWTPSTRARARRPRPT